MTGRRDYSDAELDLVRKSWEGMIVPIIGLIIAVYALARLIHLATEASRSDARVAAWTVISVLAGLLIAFLTTSLMTMALALRQCRWGAEMLLIA
jgi:uncharacterized protein YacL